MTRLRAWLLILALLLAQLGAHVHALEHLHDADDPGHPPCEWCLAFSAVQHVAAGQPPMLPVARWSVKVPPPLLVGASASFSPHYRSRAPPLSLA